MSMWHVRVDCWRDRPYKPERVRRYFVVEAEEGAYAMRAAEQKAAATAPMCGPRWLGFEATEAATIQLPYEVGKL